MQDGVAGFGFKDDLPGVAAGGAFVKGGGRGRDDEMGDLTEFLMVFSEVLDGGLFGFIS